MSTVDQIMAIMVSAFDPVWGETWNRRQVSDAIVMPNTHAVLIDTSGQRISKDTQVDAVGFALTKYVPAEEELLLIAVRPEFRRRGIGRRLIDLLVTDARERGAERIFLEMRENNPAASLYGEVGFEPIGRRKAYYLLADGSRLDAITYGLTV